MTSSLPIQITTQFDNTIYYLHLRFTLPIMQMRTVIYEKVFIFLNLAFVFKLNNETVFFCFVLFSFKSSISVEFCCVR